MSAEISEPLLIPEYIPDQDLYPGQKFSSYNEMKEACPELDRRKDEMDRVGMPYTPMFADFRRKYDV